MVPIDLATTSWTPKASKTERIGPPAIIPVPGGALEYGQKTETRHHNQFRSELVKLSLNQSFVHVLLYHYDVTNFTEFIIRFP